MKNTLLICFLCFLIGKSYSQSDPNEKLVYVVSYNMNGLMTTMAQVDIETELVKTAKSTYLHTGIAARTFTKWDTYFKVRDSYDSYVNPITLKPRMYKRNVSEGGYTKTEKYVFSADGRKITTTTKRKTNPEVKGTVAIGSGTVDVVSLLSQLRAMDFKNFTVGERKNFTIVFDSKEFVVSIKYMGKETIDVGNIGRQVCHKMAVNAKSEAIQGKDKNLIWFTEGEKIPALMKFSIPVGSGVLKLKTVSKIK
jgi:hypothetical protein